MQCISNALAPLLDIKQYLPHLLPNELRHFPYKTESGLCHHGTSQLNQDCWGSTGGSQPLSPKVNEGCGPVRVTIWFFVQVTISNKLPQTLSRPPWTWREVTSPGGGAWELAQFNQQEWVQDSLRSFPKSPLKDFWQTTVSAYKPENASVLRKSSTSDDCECWVQGKEISLPGGGTQSSVSFRGNGC